MREDVDLEDQGVPGLLVDLADPGVKVASVEVHRPTLDDVFLNLTGRSLREGGTAAESGSTVEPLEV